VGGFLGTEEALNQWLELKIQQWVLGVKSLAQVTRRYPQTAYAGLAMSLQQEWQYLQRVVTGCGTAFQPIEDALWDVFIPALLQGVPAETQRKLTSLAVRHAGLGIPDPTSTAVANYDTLCQAPDPLSLSWQEPGFPPALSPAWAGTPEGPEDQCGGRGTRAVAPGSW
jgi:hypothetical protein